MGVFVIPSDPSLEDLIRAAQADPDDDSAAMAEILNRFAGSITATANSVTSEWNACQDAAQGARLGLVKAVRKHAVGTAGFISYARRYMRTEAVRTCAAMAGKTSSSPEGVRERSVRPGARRQGWAGVEPKAFTIESISALLDPTQARILTDRYLHDREMSDIARDLGVSVPAISQRLKTIHKVLLPALVKAVAA
ncbi:sigma factor-like helix-turn-helix DNA-binding protein [Nocardioides sp. LHD-245]|uniref:sigma factor-like helix-turn-helix DNA-binding protein n=1 Tax=Nocardioides sp. LHD-245 TaxID=3051387 RepID=UPI0027E0FC3D|nr:sigma factor-like helix-turn-helix DNA-binding protein [Nocardioides sp. LHD-245]